MNPFSGVKRSGFQIQVCHSLTNGRNVGQNTIFGSSFPMDKMQNWKMISNVFSDGIT